MELPHRVKETGADVVLFSSMVTASMAYFLRKKIDVPMVTINHGRDVTLPVGIYQWFVPKVFERLDGVISVSEATRDECTKRGMAPEKGVALPNGFDLNRLDKFLDKDKSRKNIQQKFNIPLDQKKMLLTVGRNVKRKGHEWFVREVMPLLGEEVVYVTVGDGPEFENIQEATNEVPFKERIFLLGRQPDRILKQAYAAADLFVMPNIPVEGDMEGFGIVLLEANMARTPAVAADLEGIKDVISQGENGYRVPTLNPSEFAEKIQYVLDVDLESLSEHARRHVEKQFSWRHVAEEYVNYLETVIDHYTIK
jgi:phosphatidylinositol alpha-1,6-mannosyltransferase